MIRLTTAQADLLRQAQAQVATATRERDLIVVALTAGRYKGTMLEYSLTGRDLTLTTTENVGGGGP